MDGQNRICWVCFPMRDGTEPLQGELAAARRRFFTEPNHSVTLDRAQNVKGFSGHVRGKLSRRRFHWKKKVSGTSGGEAILEEAFGHKDGWTLVVRDLYGVIVSRTFFDKQHEWLRTEYYEPWDSNRARVRFSPGSEAGTVQRRDWDPENKHYRDSTLYQVPYHPGTAGQSMVDAQFGTPQLLMAMAGGEVCCCPKAEADARLEAMKNVSSGTVVLMPAWEIKGGELIKDDGGDVSITFTSLEEYAKIEPAEPDKPLPAIVDESAPERADPVAGLPAVEPHKARHMQETVNFEELIDGPVEPEPETRAAPVQEPEPPKQEPPVPVEEAAMEGEPVEDAPDEAAPAQEISPDDDISLESILAEAVLYADAPALPEPSQETAGGVSIPSGYTGDIKDGRITGRGRTEQRNGLTSYEGDYVDGKRHGFGTYYYKDGNLCYAGSWKDGRRDGLGVSFRDSDHALHVANWKEGQPGGLVTLFDSHGNLRYSGRIEDGKKEGAGVVVSGEDGTVFVGQWSGGEATGLGSAFDRDGRLLYYGGWKDGKRHGHGTEFDLNGGVVFDGEFRDGKYFNGVLYQKL